MSPVSYTWAQGDSYEQYIGRWSRRVAPRFLSWLSLPAGLRWLDVGCGTGALSAAILDRGSPSSVTGVEPSEGFLWKAWGQARQYLICPQCGQRSWHKVDRDRAGE